jgi:hypothetical protein
MALRIYEDRAVAGLRDTMEAVLLCKDADIEFFQVYVCRGLDEKVIRLYRDMFYDIDEVRDMPFWVQRNLFVPNRSLSDKKKFDTAFMWKVVAYHGGTTSLLQYSIDGMPMTDELRSWFRNMGVTEYVRQVLKSSHSYAKLLDGAGTPALPMASNWEKQQQEAASTTGNDTEGAAEALAEAIRMAPDDTSQEIEFVVENKFSDEDNAK